MNKPADDPKAHEPKKQTSASEASAQNPEDIADDPPPETVDTPVDPMSVDPSSTKPPSPAKPAEENAGKTPSQQAADDVIITGTTYVEPGNPTILAKHSAKEELLEKSKSKFDIASYSHLGVNELFSGYLSQLHAGRDLEVDIIKKMRQKYEV
jgi:hypothetical protein